MQQTGPEPLQVGTQGRPEDAGKRGADARNPDLAFGGEAGRSAAAQMYASSLLSEC